MTFRRILLWTVGAVALLGPLVLVSVLASQDGPGTEPLMVSGGDLSTDEGW